MTETATKPQSKSLVAQIKSLWAEQRSDEADSREQDRGPQFDRYREILNRRNDLQDGDVEELANAASELGFSESVIANDIEVLDEIALWSQRHDALPELKEKFDTAESKVPDLNAIITNHKKKQRQADDARKHWQKAKRAETVIATIRTKSHLFNDSE